MNRLKIIYETSCCLLIILFGYTGVSKLLALDTFQFDLLNNIPALNGIDIERILSIGIPVIEILVAGLLIFPITRKIGLSLSLALMTAFTFYVGFILYFSKDIPCTCGGVLRAMSWTQHLWFNVFFTVLAFSGLIVHLKIQNYSGAKSNLA